MKNRITELFGKGRSNLLAVYYTAGFPQLDSTFAIARRLEEGGADLIEIGIPFSDPIADGPTIQESNKIALDNGMTVPLLLEQTRQIRQSSSLPIILMGYLNPVMQYGIEKFINDAATAGVDGVIIPDMPLYEFEEQYAALFNASNLCSTFLISPTTSEERIRKIDSMTNGFIYAVSASSTTGARKDFTPEQLSYFSRLKNMRLNNPFLIGFGISDHRTFSAAASFGAGAIVGSAFISMLKRSQDIDREVVSFVKSIKSNGQV